MRKTCNKYIIIFKTLHKGINRRSDGEDSVTLRKEYNKTGDFMPEKHGSLRLESCSHIDLRY